MNSEKENPPNGLEARGGNLDVSQYTRAVRILNHEKQFRELNSELFSNEVEGYAVNEMNHQRSFSVQTILERIRWKDRVDDKGNPVRVPNDFGAVWARLLVERYPEMRKYIQMRPSMFDEVPPEW